MKLFKLDQMVKRLIDLKGSGGNSNLQLTSQDTLVDSSKPNSNPIVLCSGINSIKMKFGDSSINEGDLIIINN